VSMIICKVSRNRECPSWTFAFDRLIDLSNALLRLCSFARYRTHLVDGYEAMRHQEREYPRDGYGDPWMIKAVLLLQGTSAG